MRKIRLTRLERDILWLLEEAGEETLRTVYATLKAEKPQIVVACEVLRKIGLIVFSVDRNNRVPTIQLTRAGRNALVT